jgi:hypothetical protein
MCTTRISYCMIHIYQLIIKLLASMQSGNQVTSSILQSSLASDAAVTNNTESVELGHVRDDAPVGLSRPHSTAASIEESPSDDVGLAACLGPRAPYVDGWLMIKLTERGFLEVGTSWMLLYIIGWHYPLK